MTRGSSVTALRGLLAIVAVACALPAGATAEQASQPASAAGGLDVGRNHACAVLPSTRARCWGYGGDGALGYASTATIGDDETPAAAGPVDLGAGRTAAAISAGSVHTCALLDDRTVRCWGFGGDGRLGYGNTNSVGDDEPPSSVGPVDLGGTAKQITAGRGHSCAVLDDGTVRCWGFGANGRLGHGNQNNIGDAKTPGSAGPVKLGIGGTAQAIAAGDSHTCALLDDRTVHCWGDGDHGELGYGNRDDIGDETTDVAGPVDLGAGSRAVAISAGVFFTCALLEDHTVRCWGYGSNGRLGYGNQDNVGDAEPPGSAGPVQLGGSAKAISAGDSHACALLDDGSVRCWGYGGNGRLGYANTNSVGDNETPASVGPVDLGSGRTAVAIGAGGASTCARLDDGNVRCWGEGANGRLGYCNTNPIGDDETPGSVGPVDLGVLGRPGAGCGRTPPPSVPPPPASGPLPVAPDDAAAALAAERVRVTALRSCLRRVSDQARDRRRRARHRFAPARAKREIARRGERERGRCRRRHGRTPGRVITLDAEATGSRTITLTFQAAGTDHSKPPAARSYLVMQSPHPIRTSGDFRRADALCQGTCAFKVSRVAATITLAITHLRRHRTYYYAIAARDNVSGRTGRRSETVEARTR